jgi:hypothetical protein
MDWIIKDELGDFVVVRNDNFVNNYTHIGGNYYFKPETKIGVYTWDGDTDIPDELRRKLLHPYKDFEPAHGCCNLFNTECFYYCRETKQYLCKFCDNPKYSRKHHLFLILNIDGYFYPKHSYNVCRGDLIIKDGGRYKVVKDRIFY